MKTVAVLGAGPAGLMAAHAVGLCGRPLSVHSSPQKSQLGGAQYLHYSVPYLTPVEPERVITNRLTGTPDQYKYKVYGIDPMKVPTHVSAMEITDGEQIGVWDLSKAYNTLWDWFEGSINSATVTPQWLDEHANEFELVISSVPAPALCRRPDIHRFTYQEVWVDPNPALFLPEDTIQYNGDNEPSWYRASNIGGTAGGTEWSANGRKPPLPGLVLIKKPITHNCDCFPDVFRVGRYGQWMKGVLTHDAFFETGRMLTGKELEE
jgi:hypothetical protein